VSWVFVACLSIIFATEDFVFDRALFMLPWIVLSGLGLAFIIRFVCFRVGQIRGFRDFRFWIIVMMLAFVFLAVANSSLNYLFNINIW
jgi:hypothetical protein